MNCGRNKVFAGLIACLTVGSVQAGALCQFAKAALNGVDVSQSLQGVPCDVIQSTDGAQYFCALEFSFRSDAARDTYNQYIAEMRACFNGGAQVPAGSTVNHPDSYDQTIFAVQGRQVSIALKDKGALQKSFVFVRLPAN